MQVIFAPVEWGRCANGQGNVLLCQFWNNSIRGAFRRNASSAAAHTAATRSCTSGSTHSPEKSGGTVTRILPSSTPPPSMRSRSSAPAATADFPASFWSANTTTVSACGRRRLRRTTSRARRSAVGRATWCAKSPTPVANTASKWASTSPRGTETIRITALPPILRSIRNSCGRSTPGTVRRSRRGSTAPTAATVSTAAPARPVGSTPRSTMTGATPGRLCAISGRRR